MSIVKVKTKGQVTLPASLRDLIGLSEGDLLQVKLEKGKITLTPQSLVDRELAISLDDVKKGRMYGPFNDAESAVNFLHTSTKKRKQIKFKK